MIDDEIYMIVRLSLLVVKDTSSTGSKGVEGDEEEDGEELEMDSEPT